MSRLVCSDSTLLLRSSMVFLNLVDCFPLFTTDISKICVFYNVLPRVRCDSDISSSSAYLRFTVPSNVVFLRDALLFKIHTYDNFRALERCCITFVYIIYKVLPNSFLVVVSSSERDIPWAADGINLDANWFMPVLGMTAMTHFSVWCAILSDTNAKSVL